MEQIRFTVKPNYSGTPNPMHLDAQIRFPHLVKRDRTKYTRKVKHKGRVDY